MLMSPRDVPPWYTLPKEENMSKVNVVRAWKDPKYRASLSTEELAGMPANPAGMIAASGAKLRSAGENTRQLTTAWFCTMYSVGGSRCCP